MNHIRLPSSILYLWPFAPEIICGFSDCFEINSKNEEFPMAVTHSAILFTFATFILIMIYLDLKAFPLIKGFSLLHLVYFSLQTVFVQAVTV